MKYEYKVITLNTAGNHPSQEKIESINPWFEKGWEYVDTIQQNGYDYSAVGVVLRKIKEEELVP